jgi:hypothetical protein
MASLSRANAAWQLQHRRVWGGTPGYPTKSARWEDIGVTVLEASFITDTTIWLRTSGLTEIEAESVCGAVADDANDHFGQTFVVRVHGATGIDDVLARCGS